MSFHNGPAQGEKIALFTTCFGQVAKELGGFVFVPEVQQDGAWQVVGQLISAAERATLRVALSLSEYAPTMRATVQGEYPRTAGGASYSFRPQPEIGFVVTRPAKQIAADIRRRFMPEYVNYNAKAVAYVQACQKREDEEKEALALLTAGGFQFYHGQQRGYQSTAVGRVAGECLLTGGSSVEVTFRHLTPALAVQVAAFIRQAA